MKWGRGRNYGWHLGLWLEQLSGWWHHLLTQRTRKSKFWWNRWMVQLGYVNTCYLKTNIPKSVAYISEKLRRAIWAESADLVVIHTQMLFTAYQWFFFLPPICSPDPPPSTPPAFSDYKLRLNWNFLEGCKYYMEPWGVCVMYLLWSTIPGL